MNVYIDTNLVIARTVASHPHHSEAVLLFSEIRNQNWLPVISSHGVAEIYSVLTRMPPPMRLSPAEVWQTIQENILPSFEVVALTLDEQFVVIRDCSRQGIAGGLVYDALHLGVARKARCERIYTHNVRHFRQVAPDLHDRIRMP